jgi:hypothetical protein
MIAARRSGRINRWPSHTIALATAEGDVEVSRKMTIWPTIALAKANMTYGGSAGSAVSLEGSGYALTEGGDRILLEAV